MSGARGEKEKNSGSDDSILHSSITPWHSSSSIVQIHGRPSVLQSSSSATPKRKKGKGEEV